jgi:hypothetical protein
MYLLISFSIIIDGLLDVIVHSSPEEKWKNRGFCFLDYDSHSSASRAMRRLSVKHVNIFKRNFALDWANPEEEVSSEIMSKVSIAATLFVFGFKVFN